MQKRILGLVEHSVSTSHFRTGITGIGIFNQNLDETIACHPLITSLHEHVT